jgi:mono/diheme cytochrome c family protein
MEALFPILTRFLHANGVQFAGKRTKPSPDGIAVVENASHCGTCHTPKTVLGGDKNDHALTGATLQGWFAPDITNDSRKGIGGWSKDDLIQYLKTGANNWTLASGPMAEA